MKKLLSIALVLVMCISALTASFTVNAADEENLLAGASYEYQVGEFFSSFTDNNRTLLTNGKYRGDGEASFDGMYAVAGTTVELTGDTGATHINNVIVFNVDGVISVDSLVLRRVRRIGNRYTNIASIETSSDGVTYKTAAFDETQTAVAGAPTLGGSFQYFDVTATFKQTATKVSYIKITLNTLTPSGERQYLVQLDEVEAYGSVTGRYTPAAEVSVAANKKTVRPGEYVTVTVLLNNISTPNGVVACDLPLSYDNTLLRLTACTGIYPKAWGTTGIVVGDKTMSDMPYWLRLVCDADDLAANSVYNVKGSGVLGFTLTFKALAEGKATITVDNIPENGDFMLVVNGADFNNYGATGASTDITVSGEAIVSEKGDVNEDGIVDNLDAAMVLRYDAGIIELDEGELDRGDVNMDGSADNLDASLILQYDAGLIPDL